MKLEEILTVEGVEFAATKHEVRVHPPSPEKPKRYYANLNPVRRKELATLCRAVEGCWKRSDFVDQIIAKGSGDSQSVTGFEFFQPDEYYEETPEIRVGLSDGDRGVITTFTFGESVEASVAFFVELSATFLEFCVRNEIKSKHTMADVDRLRKFFS